MFKFNASAMRPATGDARLAAANDLVSRTLAQNGITTGSMPSGLPRMAMPDLSQWTGMTDRSGAMPHGMTAGTFTCASGHRDYLVHVPSSAKDGAKGLVVMLHGCTQNPADFATGTGMNALADRDGFIVLYPQQSRGDNAQSCWNWFSRGDQLRDKGEPAILAGMTQEIAAQHGIGADLTFVAGLSAGAAMAVILGQTYPDVFAAVGAHSGLPYSAARDVPSAFAAMGGQGADVAAPDGPAIPTIVFHGTGDSTVNPVNGQRIAAHAVSRTGQTIETEATGTTNGRGWHLRTSADMKSRAVLEHWVVDGLGHAWSGGQPGGSYTDAKGPDASAEMLRFFFETTGKALT
ncbi:alpha/beta hydrolase family esterase [Loktanella sp. DJP18]|uniref:extracellular catalytic domain type 1 short-chain-length polyhydroxyalkanoate depolymerase n=1 Tax=Loktanella sp. DJP18 TaxID=3409788 RepID=UPI003BB5FB04